MKMKKKLIISSVLLIFVAITVAIGSECWIIQAYPCPSTLGGQTNGCPLISGAAFLAQGVPAGQNSSGWTVQTSDDIQHCLYNCNGTNTWAYWGMINDLKNGTNCLGGSGSGSDGGSGT